MLLKKGILLIYRYGSFCGVKELVLYALQSDDGYDEILRYVSNELYADKEIVMISVHNCGETLEYASKVLWEDKELVLCAIQNDHNAVQYIYIRYIKK